MLIASEYDWISSEAKVSRVWPYSWPSKSQEIFTNFTNYCFQYSMELQQMAQRLSWMRAFATINFAQSMIQSFSTFHCLLVTRKMMIHLWFLHNKDARRFQWNDIFEIQKLLWDQKLKFTEYNKYFSLSYIVLEIFSSET